MNQQENTPGSEGIIPVENANSNQQNAGTETPVTTPQGVVTPLEKKTFTQDEVNMIVASERKKSEEKMSKLKEAGLTEEQIKILSDQEAIRQGKEELELIRMGKVESILEKHKDLVSSLDAPQVEKLKSGSPDKVEDFLSGLSSIVNKAKGTQGQVPAGEMPSMNEGSPANNVPSDVAQMAEGIDSGIKTGDWSKAISSLFGKFSQ